MVVGIGLPRPVALKRARGLAALGVAQIGRDNAKLPLELVEWVERVRRKPRDRRVEPAAGDHQQREAGAGLFVMDTNLASFIERHGFLPFAIHVIIPARAEVPVNRMYAPFVPLLRGVGRYRRLN